MAVKGNLTPSLLINFRHKTGKRLKIFFKTAIIGMAWHIAYFYAE